MADFRIADTFTDSLARLNSDEQKAVKTTAFALQITPKPRDDLRILSCGRTITLRSAATKTSD